MKRSETVLVYTLREGYLCGETLNWSFICPWEVSRWIPVWIFSSLELLFFLLPLTQRTQQNKQQQSSNSNFTSPKLFSVVKARLLLLFNTVALNHKLYRLSSGKTELCYFPVLFWGFCVKQLSQTTSWSVSGTVLEPWGFFFCTYVLLCCRTLMMCVLFRITFRQGLWTIHVFHYL